MLDRDTFIMRAVNKSVVDTVYIDVSKYYTVEEHLFDRLTQLH